MSEDRQTIVSDHDRLITQLADLDEASELGRLGVTADSTVKNLKTELETLLSDVRQPPSVDEFENESGCHRALEMIRAIGQDPSFTGGQPTTQIAAEREDLGSLREYKLLSKLGQGGMGTVYKALHTKLDKIVALKVLPTDKLRDEHAVTRFEREMKAVGRLEHSNIVRATDAGEIDGQHFLVMEYVDGLDLSTIVHSLGPLPVADACEVVRQAAIGLQHAHEHGLVHRDIKPSNLMVQSVKSGETRVQSQQLPTVSSGSRPSTLDSQPSVKLLDMGLALLEEHRLAEQRELTTTGQMMGTLDYMAPEQGIDSHEVDIRADIYSLGATLFRLLTGEAPFPSKKYGTPMKMLMALATESARSITTLRDDLPSGLAEVVDRMLKKNPDERFSTPQEVAAALEPFVAGCDLANLLARAQRNSGVEDDGTSLAGTNEYLSAPSTETEADAKEPIRAKAGQTDRFEKTQLAKTLPRPASWYRRPTIVAAVALGVIGLLLAAAVISIMTDKGELIVRSEDDNIEVTVKRHNGEPVEDIELTKGQGQTTLRSGKYEVVISGVNADQFSITPKLVTLSRGEEKVVTIERKDAGSKNSEVIPQGVARLPAASNPPANRVAIKPEPLRAMDVGDPLGPAALVARPAKIDGVRSWTIETEGHREEVRSVVSFDADSLITHGLDGTVRLWDVRTRKLSRMIFTSPAAYHDVVRRPNGRLLVTGRNASDSGPISLWDAKTFQLLCNFEAPSPYWGLILSPDEKQILCRSIKDGTIWILDAGSGEVTHQFSHPGISGFDLSPDGKWLASAGSDTVIKVHSVNGGKSIREFEHPDAKPGDIHNCTWSSDSQLLCAAYHTTIGSRVLVWDVTKGNIVYRSEASSKTGKSVSWKEGAHKLLIFGDGTLELFDVDNGVAEWTTDVRSVGPRGKFEWSPDGSKVAFRGKLFESSSGKMLRDFEGTDESMTWSPDGRILAGPSNGGTVAFWGPSAARHLFQIQGVAGGHTCWSMNGNKPAAQGFWSDTYHYVTRCNLCSKDGSLLLSSAGSLRSIFFDIDDDPSKQRMVELSKGVWYGLASSPTGDQVVAADKAGGIKMWDVATKQIVHVLREQGPPVFQSMWSDDDHSIVVKDSTGITAWNAESAKQIFTTPINYNGGFAINRTSDKFANVESKSIAIRSMQDGAVLARIDLSPPATTQRSIAWLDDKRTVVVACQDGILRFVDTDSMSTVRVIENVPPDGGFNDEGSNYTWELTPHSVRVLETATGRTETITWLRDDNWLIVTDDGHYRASPALEHMLIYAVETEDGTQHIMSPDEFSEKYDWQNDPNQVRLISSD